MILERTPIVIDYRTMIVKPCDKRYRVVRGARYRVARIQSGWGVFLTPPAGQERQVDSRATEQIAEAVARTLASQAARDEDP